MSLGEQETTEKLKTNKTNEQLNRNIIACLHDVHTHTHNKKQKQERQKKNLKKQKPFEWNVLNGFKRNKQNNAHKTWFQRPSNIWTSYRTT